jgi:hypothetical protein
MLRVGGSDLQVQAASVGEERVAGWATGIAAGGVSEHGCLSGETLPAEKVGTRFVPPPRSVKRLSAWLRGKKGAVLLGSIGALIGCDTR